MSEPPSARTRVRRGSDRAVYELDAIHQILDGAMIAHVGVVTDHGPVVLPMAFGRDADYVYLHGAAANHLLGTGEGQEICVTVTHVDGLVMARTPFHNSMNYRSVVVRGLAEKIGDPDGKVRALKTISDHIVPNWDLARPPSEIDVQKTIVLRVPLSESSAKVRTGDPVDEPHDIDGPWWAGVIPIETRFGEPAASADLTSGAATPSAFAALAGRATDDRPAAP
jgi:uncharacterized protein